MELSNLYIEKNYTMQRVRFIHRQSCDYSLEKFEEKYKKTHPPFNARRQQQKTTHQTKNF